MSYKGKKPVFNQVYTDEVVFHDNQNPITPPEGYSTIFIKNGQLHTKESDGSENTVSPISALNAILEVRDQAYMGEPVFLYSDGTISYQNKDTEIIGDTNQITDSIAIPTNSGEFRKIVADSFQNDIVFHNMGTLIREGQSTFLYKGLTKKIQRTQIEVENDLFSVAVHSREVSNVDIPSYIHTVYAQGKSIMYQPFNAVLSPLGSPQEILAVDDLRFVKIICFNQKNNLTDPGIREFAVIYVDGVTLKVASFKYQQYIVDIRDGSLTNEWRDMYTDPFIIRRAQVILVASLQDHKTISTLTDTNIKHIHINRTALNATTVFSVVVSESGVLVEKRFEVPDAIVSATRHINVLGSFSSGYDKDALLFGSLSCVTGANIRYYIKDDILYVGGLTYNLHGEGTVLGVTNYAKGSILSVFFVDRVIDIDLNIIGGSVHPTFKYTRNYILHDGHEFSFGGVFNNTNNHYESNFRSMVQFIDINGHFAVQYINKLDNIIQTESNSPISLTSDVSLVNRMIKPLTENKYVVSGDANNSIQIRDFDLSTTSNYPLTIQGVGSTIKPYALPISFDRMVVVSKFASDSQKINLDVRRTDNAHFLEIINNDTGDIFNVTDPDHASVYGGIKELLFIGVSGNNSFFAVRIGNRQVLMFKWNEATKHSEEILRFSDSTIVNIASGQGVLFILTGSKIRAFNTLGVSLVDTSYPASTSKLMFGHSDGVMFLYNTGVNKYINIYNNNAQLIGTLSGNHLFTESLTEQMKGFFASNLKCIANNNKRFTFVYKEDTSTYQFIEHSAAVAGVSSNTKNCCGLNPRTGLKLRGHVLAYPYINGTHSLLLARTLDAQVSASDIEAINPALESPDVIEYDMVSMDDKQVAVSYIDEQFTAYSILINGNDGTYVHQNYGVKAYPNKVCVVNPFANYTVSFYATKEYIDADPLLNRTSKIYVHTNSSESLQIEIPNVTHMFATAYGNYITLVTRSSDGVVRLCDLTLSDTGVLSLTMHSGVQFVQLFDNVKSISMSKDSTPISTLLITKENDSTLSTFTTGDRGFEETDRLALVDSYYELVQTEDSGVLYTSSDSLFYTVSDIGKIQLLDKKPTTIAVSALYKPYARFALYSEANFARITNVSSNTYRLEKSIRYQTDYTVNLVDAKSDVLTLLGMIQGTWFIDQYDIGFENAFGTYIGVSQENKLAGGMALVSLKGGVSAAHSGLTPKTTVFSANGMVELGIALTSNKVLLTPCDIDVVPQPSIVAPNDMEILRTKLTTITGTPEIGSLYGRPLAKRYFRISNDRFFKNIVYQGVESPFNITHTITNDGWAENSTAFYVQCRDENDLGYKSTWSRPAMFSMSLTGNIAKPSIVFPVQNDTDIPVDTTIVATPFEALISGVPAHSATDWEIWQSGVVIFSSYNDIANLTTITIPVGTLVRDSLYSVRVRYIAGVHKSPYSNQRTFRTQDIGGLLATSSSVNPTLSIFKRDILSVYPETKNYYSSGITNSVAFSSNGAFLALGLKNAPYLSVLKNKDSWISAGIDNLPTSSVKHVAICNSHLAVAVNNSSMFMVYRRDDEGFYSVPVNSIIGEFGVACAFNTSGSRLALLSNKRLCVYTRVADTFTKVFEYDVSLITPRSVTINDNFVMIGVLESPYLLAWKNNSGVYSTFNIGQVINGGVNSVKLTNDRCAIGLTVYPFLMASSIVGDAFNFIETSEMMPTGTVRTVDILNNTVACGFVTAPYVRVYDMYDNRFVLHRGSEESMNGECLGVSLVDF